MHFEINNRAEALKRMAEMTDCEKAEMVKQFREKIDVTSKKGEQANNKDS